MTPNDASIDPASFWLAVVDARRGRLFRGSRTDAGRLHLDEVARVEEEWSDKEHHRPMPLAFKDGRSYAGTGHVEEERAHRFAKAVAQWAGGEAQRQGIGRLHLFAPKHFLGVLRAVLPPALQRIVQDEGHDLGPLDAGAIAAHPAVLAIPAAAERAALDARLRKPE